MSKKFYKVSIDLAPYGCNEEHTLCAQQEGVNPVEVVAREDESDQVFGSLWDNSFASYKRARIDDVVDGYRLEDEDEVERENWSRAEASSQEFVGASDASMNGLGADHIDKYLDALLDLGWINGWSWEPATDEEVEDRVSYL